MNGAFPIFSNQQYTLTSRRHRPVPARARHPPGALWLSANDGRPMNNQGVEHALCEMTRSAVGANVCPHLFRMAGASTSAIYAGDMPHLGSALLSHIDPSATEDYNRASSVNASKVYAEIIRDSYQE